MSLLCLMFEEVKLCELKGEPPPDSLREWPNSTIDSPEQTPQKKSLKELMSSAGTE